jgi:hypothetical protein
MQQRRTFYFSVPFVVVPGLIAFVGITVYQVYKKQQRDGKSCIFIIATNNQTHTFIHTYIHTYIHTFIHIMYLLTCQTTTEIEAAENKHKIKWRARKLVSYGHQYAQREDSTEVYDWDSYERALREAGAQPVLVGHWAVDKEGKHFLKLLGGGTRRRSKG